MFSITTESPMHLTPTQIAEIHNEIARYAASCHKLSIEFHDRGSTICATMYQDRSAELSRLARVLRGLEG